MRHLISIIFGRNPQLVHMCVHTMLQSGLQQTLGPHEVRCELTVLSGLTETIVSHGKGWVK